MATQTLKRLAGPVALGTGSTTVYTVPAGTIAVIRSIHIANTGSSDSGVTISISADAPGTRIWPNRVCRANDVDGGSGVWVLNAGETLRAYSAIATITLTVSGVEIGP